MGTVSETMADLTADMTYLREGLEADLEEIFDHPCHASIEEVDSDTGEVTIRVELDLNELRERLKENGGYEDVDIGIDDDFTFCFSPIPDSETAGDD